jgi:hypothetical protein
MIRHHEPQAEFIFKAVFASSPSGDSSSYHFPKRSFVIDTFSLCAHHTPLATAPIFPQSSFCSRSVRVSKLLVYVQSTRHPNLSPTLALSLTLNPSLRSCPFPTSSIGSARSRLITRATFHKAHVWSSKTIRSRNRTTRMPKSVIRRRIVSSWLKRGRGEVS